MTAIATREKQDEIIARLGRSAAPAADMVAIIANGAALSAAVDLGADRAHRIVLPAAWTAAALTFQASSDGVGFADLYDRDGEVILPAAVVAANRTVVLDQAAFYGIRYLKVRSGTSAAPVNQAAARNLLLVTVPR